MKYQHLERYRLTLETLSPVFIGSSQDDLSKKESILLPKDGLVLIPDLNKLISFLEQKRSLEAFEQFLFNEGDRRTLLMFLQDQSIQVSPNVPWVQYRLRCSSADMKDRLNKLSRFVKNTQGQPYIPGSSIKGAIRTAMLARRSTEEVLRGVKETAERNARQRMAQGEENPLRILPLDPNPKKKYDAVNDLLRSLEVSDSAPFGDDSLIVCRKIELTEVGDVKGAANGDGSRKSSPPLYRECLRPSLKTHFYLTIDRSLAKDQLTIEMIQEALKQWNRVQNEYADQFDHWHLDLKGMETKDIPIVLGGGVGFQSKSLLMKLKAGRKITIHRVLKAQFRDRYQYEEELPAPYMMKLAQYNGSFYPMGRCSLKVEA